MADNMIELVASLNITDSAEQINKTDIPLLKDKIEAIKIKCELDTEGISSIQSQLASISKNLEIEAPKINADISTENISKKIGTISTVYAEGAKQSEILHLKQERLQQDYDILTAKIQKTKLALDSLATRDGVNYNEVFTGIMSKEIVDETSLNRARDALSAIRKEFQLANAQMTSDIPQNAIENFIQRIAKADSQIKILTVDYQKLNNVPQNLENSFQELQKLVSGFDFSTDFQNESKEGINEKIQAYTKIKVALNETQALLKVAQKEEAAFNKEFERELKIEERINKEKEKTFNKEFEQALKEEQQQLAIEQKRVEVAKQLREEQQHDYWQGRFEESVKGMTAENQVLKDMKKYYEDLNKAQKEVEKQEKKTFQEDNKLANRQNRIRKLTDDINSYAAANQRAIKSNKEMSNGKIFADEWSRIISEMAKGANLTDQEIKQLEADLKSFKKNAQMAGEAGESAFDKFLNSFKTMSSYITANMVFNFVKRQLRDMVQEVTAVDSAMVDLRKVADATDEEFEAFAKSAGKTGRELGASISDVINATSTFSRAGFSLPEAEELGKIATLYKNVGDGIDIESASESLISVIKAFNIQAGEYERIVDKINNVSNNFAIDSGGLGLALQRVASAMDAANNTLDETIALTTVANEVVQNPEMVAQGWRTVALRIRGAKTELEDAGLETEGMVESTAKLRDLIKGISGVDIMLDENTFKSTYEIIEEIGKVWKDISDVNQASLLEAIAGKRQSNIVAATLNNYERLDAVLDKSINSQESARREQEEYEKSIQYSIDSLKASYQDFAQTIIKSDFVKTLLGTAQNLLEVLTKIVDEVGALPPLLTAVGVGFSLKGKGIFGTIKTDAEGANRQITLFGKTFSQIKADVNSSDAKGLGKIKAGIESVGLRAKATQVAVMAMNAALSIGVSLAISAAVSGISKWLNKEKEVAEEAKKLRQEMEDRRKAAIENIQSYEEETKNINSLIGQYVKLISSTEDLSSIESSLLNIQDQVISKYKLEADAIDLVNGKIEDNISLLLQQEEQRNKDWLRENKDVIAEAQKLFSDASNIYSAVGAPNSLFAIRPGMEGLSQTDYSIMVARLKEGLESSGLSQYIESESENLGIDLSEGLILGFKEGLESQDYKRAIEDFISLYEKIMNENPHLDFEAISPLYDYLIEMKSAIDDSYNILSQYEDLTKTQINLETILENSDDLKRYVSDIDRLTKALKTYHDETQTPERRYGAGLEADRIKADIQDLISLYPALKDTAETTMGSLDTTLNDVMADEEELFSNFVKTLDGAHKTALSNIEKTESAMASAIKGEGLSHDSAWELLKLDTDKLLKPVIDSAGKYHFELDDIVALKDSIIDKNRTLIEQDMQEAQLAKQRADSELQVLQLEMARVNTRIRNEASGNTRPTEELVRKQADLRQQIESLTKSSKAYGDEIERDSILIKEYNAHSGNLLNTEKMLQAQIDALKKSQEQLKTEISDLNTQADKMLKAQEMKIDGIVDGLEAESKELEDSKQLLEDQLDILEEQKEELEEVVKNYETIANVVDSTISKQIDEIEENRQAIEDYYNNLIDKLKEENSERADALDYAEKLAALENAKNNKVRVYGTGTGWTYKVDQDALVKAQRALEDADTNKAVSELEKERDRAISGFDEQIKAFEKYADEWKNTVEEIRNQEDERLAAEIFGSDWREKIASKDIDVLKNYRSEYRNYNAQLKSITDNEIKNLKASIDAKNAEIETKKKQIQVWKDYKSSVQNAVNSIKNSLDGYDELLNAIMLDENSTYEQRQRNLNNFANKYSDIISQINRKNSELDTTTNKISNLNRQITELNNNPIRIEADVSSAADKMAEFIEKYRDAVEAMRKRLDESVTGYGTVNSLWDAQLAEAANAMRRMEGYSQGGSVAYTGLAQVHGSPNKSETVFNASQSKELWDMVRTGSFTNLVADRAIKGVSSVLNNNTSNLNNSRVININGMVIKADNPKQFHDQFMAEINKYWSVQLTESPIR